MIESIDLRREDVYIANVIKCRPPENRNPEPDEVASCEPFLFRQLDAIRPKVVVALGAVAVKALLKTDAPISDSAAASSTSEGPSSCRRSTRRSCSAAPTRSARRGRISRRSARCFRGEA